MALKIRVGTRPSQLALAQATLIKSQLEALVPDLVAELVPIRTSGDRMMTASLAQVGGKGLFIRELEQALSAGKIDLAVHSMKDLPAILPGYYRIAAVTSRENPRDALISRDRERPGLAALAYRARLGTASSRRKCEARRLRPDLEVVPLRGNIDTRLRRLAAGDFDAIILAMAGLKRLGGVATSSAIELDERDFVPAAGQGALAIETIADVPARGAAELNAALTRLNDPRAAAEVTAERAFIAALGASCVSPVGVRGTLEGEELALHALLFNPDGTRSLEGERRQPRGSDPAALGVALGGEMLARGARDLMSETLADG